MENKKIEKLVQTVKQLDKEIHREVEKPEQVLPLITGKQLKVGDDVNVSGQLSIGQITHISGNKAEVVFGQMKMHIDLNKLEKARKTDIKKEKGNSQAGRFKGIMSDINDKMANFKMQLDLRGKRADEALEEVRHYIDDAILLSVSEVSILHGKGNGILREVIRAYLASVPEVKRFKDAATDMGGSGITIASLR